MTDIEIIPRRSPEPSVDDSQEPEDDRRHLVRLLACVLARAWFDARGIDLASPPAPAPFDP